MIKITESTYHELRDEYGGVCTKCRSVRYQCEPDAEKYECESCDARAVDGIELLLIRGLILFVESSKDENIQF